MRVVLYGATGMIGSGALIECLDHPDVDSVLVVGRRPCGKADHPDVDEILLDDFEDYSGLAGRFEGADACFYCMGVSAAGMSEEDYTRLTYTFAVKAAGAIRADAPGVAFCYISGQGADSSGEGRVMWARVRGRLENDLLAMEGGPTWIFRPGFITPKKGVRSRTALYQVPYTILSPVMPALERAFPNHITSTDRLGLALIRVARDGAEGNRFHNREINALAAAERT